jgi:adenine deaminase
MRASLLFGCAALAGVAFGQPADLVLRNGKVVTMNADQPAAEAVAVRGDRIAALDGNSEARTWDEIVAQVARGCWRRTPTSRIAAG